MNIMTDLIKLGLASYESYEWFGNFSMNEQDKLVSKYYPWLSTINVMKRSTFIHNIYKQETLNY